MTLTRLPFRAMSDGEGNQGETDLDRRLTLQAAGITLFGVLLSIGITVGFGISAAWWVRVAAGVGTTVALAFGVWLLGTRTNVLARAADWITGRSYRRG